MTAPTTRSGLAAIATSQRVHREVFHWKDAVGMGRPDPKAVMVDEEKHRLDNLVQVIDGRARPYTEVTEQ